MNTEQITSNMIETLYKIDTLKLEALTCFEQVVKASKKIELTSLNESSEEVMKKVIVGARELTDLLTRIDILLIVGERELTDLLAKIDILHKELQELVDLKNQEPSKEEQS